MNTIVLDSTASAAAVADTAAGCSPATCRIGLLGLGNVGSAFARHIGPGAGPDVTAETLLDDVSELMAERRVRIPAPETSLLATSVTRPHSGWFVRLDGAARPSTGLRASESDVADLLGSYGVWTTRVARRGDRTFVLTCSTSYARVQSALGALQAATGLTAAAFPAVAGEDTAC